MRVSPTEAASYTGSVVSVGSSLTLTDIGVIVGIATAIMTFALNAYFMWRKDQREQRESAARMHEMEEHGG
ncbi:holin [Burkholderia ubonensis]|uniref:Holin n=1 Tax=Burkholderia ubonensis TaxID=101571 RepID=A0AA40R4Z4_9BURK|nr:HP1 family phage holin [Burkholderia ubonensis]KVD71779.1 holin [Burkholderia ubonensis]KVN92528.1 holin [Burkholderia ubonensis]KVT92719.1 holin [Burkholderia ubonensis]KVZ57500.1 holin [Burkholderia ubonensis]KWZ53277.1 holin [Burkholderia ubonensis]